MSTTVELVRANERYARLRAAVEGLADKYDCPHDPAGCEACWQHPAKDLKFADRLRALLAAADS